MNMLKRLLGDKSTSTVDELREALAAIQQREKAIKARLNAISTNPNGAGPGPERKRLQLEGTAADLVALDEEVALLLAELHQQLPAQAAEIRRRLAIAEADAAAKALPGLLKALPKPLREYQEAVKAAEAARAALQDSCTAVTVARRALVDQRRDAPGATAELAAEIAEAMGHPESEAPHTFSLARAQLFQRLGAPLVEREAAIEYNNRRQKGRFERDDHVDTKRHPEQSIWNRDRSGAA